MLKLAVSSQVEIREARAEDIPYMAANLRESDRIEAQASGMFTPEAALRESLAASSIAWSGLYKGNPEIMWGVAPGTILSEIGYVWLLSTVTAEKNPFLWGQFCHESIREMLKDYSRLVNYIDVRNKGAIRWVKWLGFEIGPPMEYGPLRRQFVPISLERPK